MQLNTLATIHVNTLHCFTQYNNNHFCHLPTDFLLYVWLFTYMYDPRNEVESQKVGKGSFAYAWVLDETGEERTR